MAQTVRRAMPCFADEETIMRIQPSKGRALNISSALGWLLRSVGALRAPGIAMRLASSKSRREQNSRFTPQGGPIVLLIALGFVASNALAQQTPNTPPPEPGQDTGLSTSSLRNPGQIDFGIRGTVFGANSDEAR